MVVAYPMLAGEIAKRGIKKRAIAKHIGITERALYNKMSGEASFTWDEVVAINSCFFPDLDMASLFARADPSQPNTGHPQAQQDSA